MTPEERFEEEQRKFMELDAKPYVPNIDPFDCPLCFNDIPQGRGVLLRQCCHMVCVSCLKNYVRDLPEAGIRCPCEGCVSLMEDREIKGIIDQRMFNKYVEMCHTKAATTIPNSFYCKTPNCCGWVQYEPGVAVFKCAKCGRQNCINCQTSHEGKTCADYQRAVQNDRARNKDEQMIKVEIQNGNAMKCPGCQFVIFRISGCNRVICSNCQMVCCWAVKGPRWGPKGENDTSGGCRCNLPEHPCRAGCTHC